MKTKSINYLFKPILLLLILLFNLSSQAQNEYVKRIEHPSALVLSLQQSSFIKDNKFYTVSHYDNDSATEEFTDFQKTDLVGNMQLRTPSTNDFNFVMKPLPASFFPSIYISSYIAGNATTNYFIGYIGIKMIIGEIDNNGNLSNVNTIQSSTVLGRLVVNKMIFKNNELYAVGSYTNDYTSNRSEIALFKFDLSFNVLASFTISSLFGGTQFNNEISEGLDLIVDQDDSVCVVGNIYEFSSGGVTISPIFGSPILVNHNYGLLIKLDKTNLNVGAVRIYGQVSSSILESLSFRRICQVGSELIIFGTSESTGTNFKPCILKLNPNLTINISNIFGDFTTALETLTDFAFDGTNHLFYVTTKGFSISSSSQFGVFYNPLFMKNLSNDKGSIYKIDETNLNVISRRQLNVVNSPIKLSMETINYSDDVFNNANDRLIITGINNDLGDFNKFIWYINTSIFDDVTSSTCSSKLNFGEVNRDFELVEVGLLKTNISLSNTVYNYNDFQLIDFDQCETPLTDVIKSFKSIKTNSNSQIEGMTITNFEKFVSSEQNTTTYKYVKIYAMNGQIIYNKPSLDKFFLYSLTNGFYLIQLINQNDQTKNIKLLINN